VTLDGLGGCDLHGVAAPDPPHLDRLFLEGGVLETFSRTFRSRDRSIVVPLMPAKKTVDLDRVDRPFVEDIPRSRDSAANSLGPGLLGGEAAAGGGRCGGPCIKPHLGELTSLSGNSDGNSHASA